MLAQCRLLDSTHLSSEEKLQLFHRWGISCRREELAEIEMTGPETKPGGACKSNTFSRQL